MNKKTHRLIYYLLHILIKSLLFMDRLRFCKEGGATIILKAPGAAVGTELGKAARWYC